MNLMRQDKKFRLHSMTTCIKTPRISHQRVSRRRVLDPTIPQKRKYLSRHPAKIAYLTIMTKDCLYCYPTKKLLIPPSHKKTAPQKIVISHIPLSRQKKTCSSRYPAEKRVYPNIPQPPSGSLSEFIRWKSLKT